MKRYFSVFAACLMLAGCNNSTTVPTNDRDNTAVNERDANGGSVTPIDQSNDAKDIDQVAAIRREVMDIDDLSINGQNVKIITGGGRVVLRGPVDSQAEKDAIANAAKKHAGGSTITNELEVESN